MKNSAVRRQKLKSHIMNMLELSIAKNITQKKLYNESSSNSYSSSHSNSHSHSHKSYSVGKPDKEWLDGYAQSPDDYIDPEQWTRITQTIASEMNKIEEDQKLSNAIGAYVDDLGYNDVRKVYQDYILYRTVAFEKIIKMINSEVD